MDVDGVRAGPEFPVTSHGVPTHGGPRESPWCRRPAVRALCGTVGRPAGRLAERARELGERRALLQGASPFGVAKTVLHVSETGAAGPRAAPSVLIASGRCAGSSI